MRINSSINNTIPSLPRTRLGPAAQHARNDKVMRIREPQATGLLFPTGKVVVTGAAGVEAAREAANKFVAVVATLGLKPATNPHAL